MRKSLTVSVAVAMAVALLAASATASAAIIGTPTVESSFSGTTDLTTAGTTDWLFIGNPNAGYNHMMAGSPGLISVSSSAGLQTVNGYTSKIKYENGDNGTFDGSGWWGTAFSRCGNGRSMTVTCAAQSQEMTLTLLAGYNASAGDSTLTPSGSISDGNGWSIPITDYGVKKITINYTGPLTLTFTAGGYLLFRSSRPLHCPPPPSRRR